MMNPNRFEALLQGIFYGIAILILVRLEVHAIDKRDIVGFFIWLALIAAAVQALSYVRKVLRRTR